MSNGRVVGGEVLVEVEIEPRRWPFAGDDSIRKTLFSPGEEIQAKVLSTHRCQSALQSQYNALPACQCTDRFNRRENINHHVTSIRSYIHLRGCPPPVKNTGRKPDDAN